MRTLASGASTLEVRAGARGHFSPSDTPLTPRPEAKHQNLGHFDRSRGRYRHASYQRRSGRKLDLHNGICRSNGTRYMPKGLFGGRPRPHPLAQPYAPARGPKGRPPPGVAAAAPPAANPPLKPPSGTPPRGDAPLEACCSASHVGGGSGVDSAEQRPDRSTHLQVASHHASSSATGQDMSSWHEAPYNIAVWTRHEKHTELRQSL